MDAASRMRRRRGGSPRLPNLALIAGLFLHPSQLTSTAAAAAVGLPAIPLQSSAHLPHLHRRNEGEHVVLADCRDSAGVISSQMAYFPGDPGKTPQDVAVVSTPAGQAALWVNTKTTGFFTVTSTTFVADLGPRVEEGKFAGTGNNGYGNFSCYQIYHEKLYSYGGTLCAQVYLCDHSDPPAGYGSNSGGGMSQGTIIGIAVGVVGGLLFIAAAGLVYWYFRRSRRDDAARSELLRTGTLSTGTGPGSDATAVETVSPLSPTPQTRAVMQQMSAVYEVDGRLFRIEMANDNGKFEMDAAGHGSAELDTAPKPEPEPSSPEIKTVSPLTPGLPDSPVVKDISESPPPKYAR